MVKDKKPDDAAAGTAADPRFSAVQYDPRFQRFPKNKSKVQVDDRFKGMFNDPAFQVGVTVDKRGKKVKGKKNTENMKKYYRLQDEDDWKKDDAGEKEEEEDVEGKEEEVPAKTNQGAKSTRKVAPAPLPPSSSEESSEEESDEEEAEAAKRWARMRGLDATHSSSDEDNDSDTDTDTDGNKDSDEDQEAQEEDYSASDFDDAVVEDEDDEAAVAEFGVGALAANPKEQIPLLPDATPRLACVDLDWENVTAVDILVALRSFLPRGGSIKSVTVYPSDYGLERMEAEAKSGPQGIWRQKVQKNTFTGGDGGDGEKQSGRKKDKHTVEASSSDNEDEEEEAEDVEDDSVEEGSDAESEEESESDADGEVDHARLRLYERSKLRWYYAIVDCDSTETANQLYDECDGMELMKTACKFDLRFVPDDQSFKNRKIRDQAKDVPSDYEPPTFQTKALQHTNVELTWDKGDESRKRALTRKLTAEEIKEDDFKAYLATESESGDGSDTEDEEDEDSDGGDLPLRKKGSGGDDAEAIRERYRRLLLGGGGGSGVSPGKDKEKSEKERKGKKDWTSAVGNDDDEHTASGISSDDEKEDVYGNGAHKNDRKMEMEVTFTSGLESLGDRLIAKRKEAEIKAGETVWDAYLRRKREKKAAAKKLGIVNVDSDDDDYDEEYSTNSDDNSGSEAEEEEEGGGGGVGQRKQQQERSGRKKNSVGKGERKAKGGDQDQSDEELPSGVADDPFFQHDDDPFNDPFFQDGPGASGAATKKSGKEGGRKKIKKGSRGGDDEVDDEEVRREKAELEMLLLDESALLRKGIAGNMTTANGDGSKPVKLSKKERIRLKKESKRRERAMGSDDEDHQEAAGAGFKMNLEDPRFKELLVAPDFALDPTDPRFTKAGPGAALIASEVAKRRGRTGVGALNGAGGVGNGKSSDSGGTNGVSKGKEGVLGATAAPEGGNNKSAADLKLMVASLKRKASMAAAVGRGGEGSSGGKKKAAKRK